MGRAPLAKGAAGGQTAGMTFHAFRLGQHHLHALPSGALWWPARRLLAVSDLHFGKAARLARRGGALLPPYDTRETLARLDAVVGQTDPATVLCLGDSFDDTQAAGGLDEAEKLWLARLCAGRDWIWIEGNHDPGPLDVPGTHRAEVRLDGLTFRHVADPAARGEVSGHYHPKARLAGRARPCFLIDEDRVILPALGSFTGGLSAEAPVLAGLMRPGAIAVLTGTRALAMPMPRPDAVRR